MYAKRSILLNQFLPFLLFPSVIPPNCQADMFMSVRLGPIHVPEPHVDVTLGKNDMTIMLMSSPLNKLKRHSSLSLCIVKVPASVTLSVVLSDAISASGQCEP